ncbi:hypothetical protein C1Y63_11865 [Corynebacterium sp. 13CS0277]|uniref:ABC transporter ATP-binding protein n=1 Tax=Corynebacterium sp. 13CS0277 TaxID=2071994 RepID=UPI000D035063|nr:ABC transporter ATP-binding protein [Corynebacterium sp. 13CS0277]PRQ10367.1 hypothetical protein C1Y63_11865 [Corynebacterium sp. 13CS0277]
MQRLSQGYSTSAALRAALIVGGISVALAVVDGFGDHCANLVTRGTGAARLTRIGAQATTRTGVSDALHADALHWVQIDGPAYFYSAAATLTKTVALGIVVALWQPWVGVLSTVLVLCSFVVVATSLATFSKQHQDLASSAYQSSRLWEVITGKSAQREIRIFAWQSWLLKLYAEATSSVSALARRNGWRLVRMHSIAGALILVSIGVACVVAWQETASGRMDPGQLSAVCFALVQMHVVGNVGHVMGRCGEVARHLGELQATTSEDHDDTDTAGAGSAPQADSLPPGAIAVRDVSFHYPAPHPGEDARQVLSGLGVTIHPGELVAIVGPNGAGKSTLAGLLAGFLTPTAGSVRVGGRLVLMHQYPTVFPGTARDNISFTASAAEVQAALAAAPGNHFVATLPQGIDTIVDPDLAGGRGLSGGQKQTLFLARARTQVADSDVLVLDEPASNLDLDAEMALYDSLREFQGMTRIMITHRLSAARAADRILVIDGGRVAEDGTHEELMAAQGVYFALYETQRRTRTATPHPAEAEHPQHTPLAEGDPAC